ncbi:MAG TPA: helix-turn-helix transcriptional regulator [Terriglobia bacterium]|nr:helix-turn-helix transcriptional regulator [Terriglobia bacterium]
MDIRKSREAVSCSRLELEAHSGVSRWRISLAESGYIQLRDEELAAIEEALLRLNRERVMQFQAAISGRSLDLAGRVSV